MMEYKIKEVPKGIRYLSEWKEFNLPDYPCIINKQITGCGFTEFCLNNNFPVILCSPRKVLLKNKESQHPGEVYYAKNNISSLGIDEDFKTKNKKSTKGETNELTKEQILAFKSNIKSEYLKFIITKKTPKFLVTYDSFRLLKEALNEIKVMDKFYVVVDEMQSIFTDSRFKADTELEFIGHLQDIRKLCYVSATPMMKKYLEKIEEFKDLPYIKLDWGKLDPMRIDYPNIDPISYRGSLVSIASSIIDDYKQGRFEKDSYMDSNGNIQEVESKEVVIFVNSVKNICDIIKKCELNFDNTNILCADTNQNKEKIRKAFKIRKSNLPEDFLMQIPKEGESHKMFTLCTKTVYLGADFYSTNARTIVLSDGNIECLAVDISLDLAQILGRQRLDCNPWRNCVELYFKTGMGVHDITEEEFNKLIEKKQESTEIMINMYNSADELGKKELLKRLEDLIEINHYKEDYIAIDKHSKSSKVLKRNDLVLISEQRAFDIQRKEYFDRMSVMAKVNEIGGNSSLDSGFIENFLIKFNYLTRFTDKMRLLCETLRSLDKIYQPKILHIIPKEFKNYCVTLGLSTIGSLSYQRGNLQEAYEKIKQKEDPNLYKIIQKLDLKLNIGDRKSKADLKSILQDIYDELGLKQTAKAIDIEKYFEIKPCKIPNKQTGKRDMGFELLKKK